MNGQTAQAIEREAEMSPLTIGFKRLSENAVLPYKAHPSDSGYDLFASEDVIIAPGETVVIPTDIAVVLPQGYEAQVRPRSGVTSKTKLRVQLGTIDEAYRGNIGIIVDNIANFAGTTLFVRLLNGKATKQFEPEHFDKGTYLIRKGDKIAQLVVQQLPQIVAVEISELFESDRGTSGFGSSGV